MNGKPPYLEIGIAAAAGIGAVAAWQLGYIDKLLAWLEGSTETCPAGTYYDAAAKVCRPTSSCPVGTYWDGAQCISEEETPPPTCPVGTYWDGMSCVTDPLVDPTEPVSCATGYFKAADGLCYPTELFPIDGSCEYFKQNYDEKYCPNTCTQLDSGLNPATGLCTVVCKTLAATTMSISGIVKWYNAITKESGTLAGATVSIGGKTAISNASGGFNITSIPITGARMTLSIRNAGYYDSDTLVTCPTACGDTSVNVGDKLMFPLPDLDEFNIDGLCYNTVGAPMDGVRVSISSGLVVYTDATGKFWNLKTPGGNVRITASKAGFKTTYMDINVTGDIPYGTVRLLMTPLDAPTPTWYSDGGL